VISTSGDKGGSWTFLTNHAHVLLCIRRDPDILLREMAARVGITERAAQQIVTDLVGAGYLTRLRVGRRNRYVVEPLRPLRHPVERDHAIGELLAVLAPAATPVEATPVEATSERVDVSS